MLAASSVRKRAAKSYRRRECSACMPSCNARSLQPEMSSQVARRTARQEMDRPRIAAAQLRHRQSRGIGHEAASMPLAFLCRPPAHPVPCRRRYGRPFWGCHGLAGRRLAAGQNGWSEPTRPGRFSFSCSHVLPPSHSHALTFSQARYNLSRGGTRSPRGQQLSQQQLRLGKRSLADARSEPELGATLFACRCASVARGHCVRTFHQSLDLYASPALASRVLEPCPQNQCLSRMRRPA